MTKRWLTPLLLCGMAGSAGAALFRDNVASVWTNKPVDIDGRATEWAEQPVMEDNGVSIRAMNDATTLYVLFTGTTNEGRITLAGLYRQAVTLWLMKPDGKTKDWAMSLDFTNAELPEDDAHRGSDPTLSDYGVAPVRLQTRGLEVSSTTLPTDVVFQADLSSRYGRQPVYELAIPLASVAPHGRVVYAWLQTAPVSPAIRAELTTPGRSTTATSSSDTATGIGGRYHHANPGAGGGNANAAIDIPKPINMRLAFKLAEAPKR